MSFFKFVILMLILGGLYYYWNFYSDSSSGLSISKNSSGTNLNKFIPVVMPNETKTNHVMILAPANCSREEARRARELADQLTKLGIPNSLISSVSFRFTKEQEQKMQQTANILNGKVPIVLFNGLGQENPSTEMVVATYFSSR
ncbi:hypothetical protein H0A36_25010 [Endozoicomonas sp. SM1973]|uniref:Uncharacterized protein n=1 Tax=Spartinivicinus marinus TaxID=2994442 RepID=A0A853I7J2_9GAMM|nr:hypothetical protein [Spartinivicinus marinus]MCX4028068.1 hypothetical protein [Spartinivicinus marinus]NYZ69283.1 hypothetical protein [Spartinivicinus marinus]